MQTHTNPVKPNKTQQYPVKPSRIWLNSRKLKVKPCKTQLVFSSYVDRLFLFHFYLVTLSSFIRSFWSFFFSFHFLFIHWLRRQKAPMNDPFPSPTPPPPPP